MQVLDKQSQCTVYCCQLTLKQKYCRQFSILSVADVYGLVFIPGGS